MQLSDEELSQFIAVPIDPDKKRRQQIDDMVVVEANDLIDKARHQLTARELKIMDFITAQIQPEDTKFHSISLSIAELTDAINLAKGGRTYKQVAASLFNLVDKPVTILSTGANGKRQLTRTNWLSEATVVEDGKVTVHVSASLSKYLLNLNGHYTGHLFRDTAMLNSRYAIILYKMMREAQGLQGYINRQNDTNYAATIGAGKDQGSPDWWKERLGIDEKQPPAYVMRTLKKAINEIQSMPELNMLFNAPQKTYEGHAVAKICISEFVKQRNEHMYY
jgi:plasmid replication initiation protein